VVSATLDRADWENSTLIRGDATEITRLKEQPGKNINIRGSATLVAWLLRQGLIDELDLLVFPVVAGQGRRLFDGDGSRAELSLAHCEAFPAGVVRLAYRPARAENPTRKEHELS
jgi:dihydrofolate reductase